MLQEYCDSGTLYDWLSRERMHPDNMPDQVRFFAGFCSMLLFHRLARERMHPANVPRSSLAVAVFWKHFPELPKTHSRAVQAVIVRCALDIARGCLLYTSPSPRD